MTDTSRERNLESGLFALAFGLALAIRLLRLGELPLNDDEARWALQALDLTRGLRTGMGPQPGYVTLTALVFFVIQAGNFAARLVPALFGAALSIVPYYFRDRLGSKPAIVLAFLLALDPGFLGMSRQAGGPVIAVCSLLFAWAAWRTASLRAAGIWAGIALLSGPSLWPGVLGLAVTYGLLRGFFLKDALLAETPPFERKAFLTLAAYAIGTYFILGSFFLLASGGLGAGLAGIPAYFGGWLDFTDVQVMRLLIGLAVYELLPVLLALVGLFRGAIKGNQLTLSLGVWLVVALVLAIANPSRQVMDLAWVLIPLLTLAAVEVSTYLVPIESGKWETIGMTVFTAAILTFAALNYAAIAMVPLEQVATQLRWWVLLGSLALLAISIAMVAFGWSIPTAVQGGLWGALLVLGAYTFSCAMASAGLRTYRTVEMWPTSPGIKQDQTLISQMNDISRFKDGVNGVLDVTIVGVDSPALRWILRDWPITVSSGVGLTGTPSLMIASDQFSSANIATTYRGQDLTWRTYPGWNQGLIEDWLRWSILHDFPSGEEKLVLWVRSDVFIDSQNNP